jgi:ribosomal protein S18 acetylase RimI-like enzyme
MHINTDTIPISTVAAITSPEMDCAVAVLCLAFSSDPAVRWMYSDTNVYISYFPKIIRAFGGKAFEHGTAQQVRGSRGVALWLPPGVHPDHEALGAIVRESLTDERQLEEVSGVFDRIGGYYPSEPHWYLASMGVDPAYQGRGYGSALLRHMLLQCDKDHVAAYLESSNPAIGPLYERHGFVVLGTIQVGSSPAIFPMLRAAQTL